MGGCPEVVAGELIRACSDPGVSAMALGCVVGLSGVGTPSLVWFGSEGVPSACVWARLGWGLGCSLLGPWDVGLADSDLAAASVVKKCNEKETRESLSPLKSVRGIAMTQVQY